jgi:hypothetical protein
MSKNNKKQHRTDGVFNSNNETYAVPQTSRNTPLSDYKFTDLEIILNNNLLDDDIIPKTPGKNEIKVFF